MNRNSQSSIGRRIVAAVLAAVAASILLPAVAQATEYLFYEPFDQFTSDTAVPLVGAVGANTWYKGYVYGDNGADPTARVSGQQGNPITYHAATPPPGISANSGWLTGYSSGASGVLLPRPIITNAAHHEFSLDFKYREDTTADNSYNQGFAIGTGSLVGDTIHFNNDQQPTLLFVVHQAAPAGNGFSVYTPNSNPGWWGGAPTFDYASYTGGTIVNHTTYELKLQVTTDAGPANDWLYATYRAFDPASSQWLAWQDITSGWVTAGRDLDGLNMNVLQAWEGNWWGYSLLMDDITLDNVIPEPGVFSLLALGGAFMVWRRKVAAKRA